MVRHLIFFSRKFIQRDNLTSETVFFTSFGKAGRAQQILLQCMLSAQLKSLSYVNKIFCSFQVARALFWPWDFYIFPLCRLIVLRDQGDWWWLGFTRWEWIWLFVNWERNEYSEQSSVTCIFFFLGITLAPNPIKFEATNNFQLVIEWQF